MHRLTVLITCLALPVLAVFSTPQTLAKDEAVFRAGAATSVITPELGGDIVGNWTRPVANHINDELHARCLVLDDGKTKIALVVCDLLGLHRSVALKAKEIIEAEVGIPGTNVAISAIHTHSATSAIDGKERSFKAEIELSEYQLFVARRIADGVHRAANLLRPAEMAYGYVDVPEHVFNRRWFVEKEGATPNPFGEIDPVKMNPGGSNKLIKPAGPTDPRVSILAFREPDGKPIALYSAYSLHYVGGVKSGDISADYYGYYCRAVERTMGQPDQDPPFVAIMANGTSGDINNVDFVNRRPSKPLYEQMKYVANDVASKVTATVSSLEWEGGLTLDSKYAELDIKWRTIEPKLLEWAKKKMAEPEPEGNKVDLSRIYAERLPRLQEATVHETAYPVHAFRIGDVCVGTTPTETFAEMGMDFRERNPFKKSFMIELTDGYYGYMPTERHFALGGYETWPSTNRLEPKAAEKTMNALLEMAKEMKADPK